MHESSTIAKHWLLDSRLIAMRLLIVGWLAGAHLFSLGVAEEAPGAHRRETVELEATLDGEAIPEDVYRSIKELGSPKYRERQAAFLRLWKLVDGGRRDAGNRLLAMAIQSTDLDVAASARWLQVLIRLSASPSEASMLIEDFVLIKSGDTETILRLARNHRWDHLLAMLDGLSLEDRARLLSESEALSGVRATVVSLAWADHEEHRIPAIVDHLWSVNEAIDARRLWRELGLEALARQVPFLAKDSKASLIWEITAEEIEGRVSEAVALARKHGREDQALSILIANSQWDQAIPIQAAHPPGKNGLTTGQAAVQAARLSLLLDWAGDKALSMKWAEAIGSPGPTEADAEGVLLAMSLCGRSDAALSIAEKRMPDEAYECLLRQGRIDEALGCIGIDHLEENAIQNWINKLTDEPPLDQQSDTETTQRMAAVGCLLSRLGLTELAQTVDQAVVQWASSVGEEHAANRTQRRLTAAEMSRERWKTVFEAWLTQHRRPFAIAQFRQLLREGMDDELRAVLLELLYENRANRDNLHLLAIPLLSWFYEQRASQDWTMAADDLERLMSGNDPTAWPVDWKRDGFPGLGRTLLAKSVLESGDDELAIRLAKLALLHKRTDLAKEWLCFGAEPRFREWLKLLLNTPTPAHVSLLADFGNLPAADVRLPVLGELLFELQDYSRANIVFEKLAQSSPERLDFLLRRSSCLRSLGEVDLADQIRLQALSTPLPVTEIRGIVSELESHALFAEAELLLKHALRGSHNRRFDNWILALQLTFLQHSPSSAIQLGRPMDESARQTQIQTLIDDGRRQLISRLDCFPEMPFKLRFALPTVEMLHRDSARLAILNGDFDSADRAIHVCHSVNPDQIETLIELVPLAESAFSSEKVEAWIDLYATPLETHLQRWPDDTLVGNNLAWLYANVERRLDRALELSQHVAELLPEDCVYLDTLAEVEFRLGNTDKAIEISSDCRRLMPLEAHYRTQLHRFLKAKAE